MMQNFITPAAFYVFKRPEWKPQHPFLVFDGRYADRDFSIPHLQPQYDCRNANSVLAFVRRFWYPPQASVPHRFRGFCGKGRMLQNSRPCKFRKCPRFLSRNFWSSPRASAPLLAQRIQIRLRQILRQHAHPELYLGVEVEEPWLGQPRHIRRLRHVDNQDAAALAVALAEVSSLGL